jgi:hypothetical protein
VPTTPNAVKAPAKSALPSAQQPAEVVAAGDLVPPTGGEPPPLPLPTLADTGRIELHGNFRGQPFWARLLPPDKQYGGNRMLQLLFTPPLPAEIDGTVLVDCPFILLDDSLRILAWNGRDGSSQVLTIAAPVGYKVSRERHQQEGTDVKPVVKTRIISTVHAWDLRLAPILLAIGWHAGASAEVNLVDLFGPRAPERLKLRWNPDGVVLAKEAMTVEADANGLLKKLSDSKGVVVVEVAGRP